MPTADRLDEGEMQYPYEQTTVPPWAFMNAPMDVLTGYLGSRLPTSEANMLVKGCVPHSGPSKNPPVTGMPACCGSLSARKKRGLIDTMPDGALGEGVLHRRRDLRRTGLVVEDDPRDLVAVDPALGVLHRDPRH